MNNIFFEAVRERILEVTRKIAEMPRFSDFLDSEDNEETGERDDG